MAGQISINIESGQFLKADPGLAKLLSVLSLQSLPRRLSLDFRDVFSEGFAFDFVRGDMLIDQGVASTNNLQMKGVNAAVLMEGRADIERNPGPARGGGARDQRHDGIAGGHGHQPGGGAGQFPGAGVPARPADRGRHAGVPYRRRWADPAWCACPAAAARPRHPRKVPAVPARSARAAKCHA
jgi:hypothetical protein